MHSLGYWWLALIFPAVWRSLRHCMYFIEFIFDYVFEQLFFSRRIAGIFIETLASVIHPTQCASCYCRYLGCTLVCCYPVLRKPVFRSGIRFLTLHAQRPFASPPCNESEGP